MMKRFILIATLVLFTFSVPAIAAEEPTTQCFVQTTNLTPAMKRWENQYDLPTPVDWNQVQGNGQAEFKSTWPKSAGKYSTNFEVDEETGLIHFNSIITVEQASQFKNDSPTFTVTCANEGTEETPFVIPTYKVKVYDEEGVWTGGYYDRTVTRMQ
jgi:hypothetical protein